VTRHFSDFLSAHAARIADLWARQTSPDEPMPPVDRARGPRQFVNAVLVALSADDFRPLIAYHHLDTGSAPSSTDNSQNANATNTTTDSSNPSASTNSFSLTQAQQLAAILKQFAEAFVDASQSTTQFVL